MTSADLLRLRQSALRAEQQAAYRAAIRRYAGTNRRYVHRERMYREAAQRDRSERALLIYDYLALRKRRSSDGTRN